MYLLHVIQKIASKKLTKLLITFIILYFLFYKIDFSTLKNNILNLNIYHWTLFFLLSFPIPLLFIFKWVYFLKETNNKIIYFKFIESISLSDIFNKFFSEIINRKYLFNRKQILIDNLANISIDSLKKFITTYLLENNNKCIFQLNGN